MILPFAPNTLDIVSSFVIKDLVARLVVYYELGMRGYRWTILTEYVIIARHFIRHFVKTRTGEEEIIKILQSLESLALCKFTREHFLNLVPFPFDSMFNVYRDNIVNRFFSSALSYLQQYQEESNEEVKKQLISSLNSLANTSLVDNDLAPNAFLPPGEIVGYHCDYSLFLPTLLPGGTLSPYILCITMECPRPERVLRLWMLLFVQVSKFMDEWLRVWVEGKYCPLPLDGQYLDHVWHFYVTLEEEFKTFLVISANSLESEAGTWAFKFHVLAYWQKISENFEGRDTPLQVNPLVLGELAPVLGEIQVQQQFFVALCLFYFYHPSEKDLIELKEIWPSTFSYHKWLYLLEKYPYPVKPWAWPWPIYWD